MSDVLGPMNKKTKSSPCSHRASICSKRKQDQYSWVRKRLILVLWERDDMSYLEEEEED